MPDPISSPAVAENETAALLELLEADAKENKVHARQLSKQLHASEARLEKTSNLLDFALRDLRKSERDVAELSEMNAALEAKLQVEVKRGHAAAQRNAALEAKLQAEVKRGHTAAQIGVQAQHGFQAMKKSVVELRAAIFAVGTAPTRSNRGEFLLPTLEEAAAHAAAQLGAVSTAALKVQHELASTIARTAAYQACSADASPLTGAPLEHSKELQQIAGKLQQPVDKEPPRKDAKLLSPPRHCQGETQYEDKGSSLPPQESSGAGRRDAAMQPDRYDIKGSTKLDDLKAVIADALAPMAAAAKLAAASGAGSKRNATWWQEERARAAKRAVKKHEEEPCIYVCKFSGCGKSYASTDAVRKHCRKQHGEWLVSLGNQGMTELYCQRIVTSKPETLESKSGASHWDDERPAVPDDACASEEGTLLRLPDACMDVWEAAF